MTNLVKITLGSGERTQVDNFLSLFKRYVEAIEKQNLSSTQRQVNAVSEWDKLWEDWGIALPPPKLVKAVGDKQQRDLIFWQEACAEMQIYKDELYDKLEALTGGLRELLEYNYMNSCRSDVENLIRDSSTSTNIEEET